MRIADVVLPRQTGIGALAVKLADAVDPVVLHTHTRRVAVAEINAAIKRTHIVRCGNREPVPLAEPGAHQDVFSVCLALEDAAALADHAAAASIAAKVSNGIGQHSDPRKAEEGHEGRLTRLGGGGGEENHGWQCRLQCYLYYVIRGICRSAGADTCILVLVVALKLLALYLCMFFLTLHAGWPYMYM